MQEHAASARLPRTDAAVVQSSAAPDAGRPAPWNAVEAGFADVETLDIAIGFVRFSGLR